MNKLAITIGAFFSINALALAVIAALSGVDHWEALTTTQQVVIAAAVLGNWTHTMLAWFNKTLSRIESGKPPVETGHTDAWKKQESGKVTTDKSPD